MGSASFSYTLTVYLVVTSLINLTTDTVQLQTKWPTRETALIRL